VTPCIEHTAMRTLILLAGASLVCFAADTGRLKTEIDPGRAGVFIDGKYVGPAANFKIARTYELSPGEHEIRLEEPRYEEIVTKVTITAGRKTILKEKMKALPPPNHPLVSCELKTRIISPLSTSMGTTWATWMSSAISRKVCC
jgi:PEGA domain